MHAVGALDEGLIIDDVTRARATMTQADPSLSDRLDIDPIVRSRPAGPPSQCLWIYRGDSPSSGTQVYLHALGFCARLLRQCQLHRQQAVGYVRQVAVAVSKHRPHDKRLTGGQSPLARRCSNAAPSMFAAPQLAHRLQLVPPTPPAALLLTAWGCVGFAVALLPLALVALLLLLQGTDAAGECMRAPWQAPDAKRRPRHCLALAPAFITTLDRALLGPNVHVHLASRLGHVAQACIARELLFLLRVMQLHLPVDRATDSPEPAGLGCCDRHRARGVVHERDLAEAIAFHVLLNWKLAVGELRRWQHERMELAALDDVILVAAVAH